MDRISHGAHNTHDVFELTGLKESIWRVDTEDKTVSKAEMRWFVHAFVIRHEEESSAVAGNEARGTTSTDTTSSYNTGPKATPLSICYRLVSF